jgi:hypothetical protein
MLSPRRKLSVRSLDPSSLTVCTSLSSSFTLLLQRLASIIQHEPTRAGLHNRTCALIHLLDRHTHGTCHDARVQDEAKTVILDDDEDLDITDRNSKHILTDQGEDLAVQE